MNSFKLLTRGLNLKRTSVNATANNTDSFDGSSKVDTASSGRKRKLDEAEIISEGDEHGISVDEIRKVQKLHKIKFTDLRQLRQEAEGSRKAHKEISRIYPQPLRHFKSLGRYEVNNAMLLNLTEHGYVEPMGAQLATIPLLMSGGNDAPDLLTIAPTGSGKTLAFLIPLIDKVGKLHREGSDTAWVPCVNAIILAPSKELRDQIVNEGRKLSARTGVRITAFKKGMRLHKQINCQNQNDSDASDEQDVKGALIVKADIVVSTPSRILHAITPAGSSTPLPLPTVHTLILDEADVLLGPLFRSETAAVWTACDSTSLQCSFWSATIGSSIEDLFIDTIESRYKSLKIKTKDQRPLLRCVVGLKDSSLPNINHKLTFAGTEHGKLIGLRDFMRPPTAPLRLPFLIFTQTIARAQDLYSEIQYDYAPSKDADMPPRIAVLHSDLPDKQRSKVMENFRLGRIWILITTDLLSRGIDFRGVGTVINYDIPTTTASYVHRAGRTGRAGREGGTCVTFWTKDDFQYLPLVVNVITKSYKAHGNGEIPEEMVPKWLLEHLPHLSKKVKKEIKERGVDVRRAVKESDNKVERRKKARNTIGTEGGYIKKLADRRKGMIEGSKRRKMREQQEHEEDHGSEQFAGFD